MIFPRRYSFWVFYPRLRQFFEISDCLIPIPLLFLGVTGGVIGGAVGGAAGAGTAAYLGATGSVLHNAGWVAAAAGGYISTGVNQASSDIVGAYSESYFGKGLRYIG